MRSKVSKFRSALGGLTAAILAMSGVLAASAPANAVTVDNNNNPIAFSNVSAVGANAAVGFTYRYENAVTIGSQVIDVIFSIAAKTSGGSVNPVDASGAPAGATNSMINSTLGFSGSTDSVTYRLEFVEDNTTTPITLQNVAINVGDIDLQQFAQFAGITNYRLSTASSTSPTSTLSELTPQTTAQVGTIPAGSYRFQSTSGGSTAEDEENWVEVRYAEVNAIEIVLGATQSGGAFFSIDFKPASWPVPAAVSVTTPTPTSYTVTYDSNTPDSGTAPSATTAAGSQTILGNSGTLVKAGFTFGGWNTAANGTGATYAPGSSIIPISAVTLYALWLPNYTLTYDGNTSTGGAAPGAISAAGNQTVLGNTGTLSKTGFTFNGWNTAADGSGVAYQAGDALNLSSNITLYAMWTPAVAGPASTTAAAAPLLAQTGPSEIQLAFTLLATLLVLSGLVSLGVSGRLRQKN
jgi:uncharacterized repeat protein (TIGR02543 family)